MIVSLPPELEAKLPEIRDEWLAIGLSTEPADRERAVAGINKAYEIVGFKPPEYIFWTRSPVEGRLLAGFMAISSTFEFKWIENEDWDKDVAKQGKSSIYLTKIKDKIHIRIFGGDRKCIVDTDEDKIVKDAVKKSKSGFSDTKTEALLGRIRNVADKLRTGDQVANESLKAITDDLKYVIDEPSISVASKVQFLMDGMRLWLIDELLKRTK